MGKSQNHGPCLGFWKALTPPSEQYSIRISQAPSRLESWPAVHRVATLWCRLLDLQEPEPPTEVFTYSHKTKAQVRPALKPAPDKLWVPWVHF